MKVDKFEYRMALWFEQGPDLQNRLNTVGDEGWQVVAMIANYYRDDTHRICSYEITFMRKILKPLNR